MKTPLLLLCLLSTIYAFAQPFATGHTTITFNDPARTGGYGSGGGPGRQIQCEVYYPADNAGNNVPVAAGDFPIIVFGHGFFMAWDAYENVWEHYVPQGYLMVFPRTEGNINPNHADFGKDLVIAAQRMELLASDGVSPFDGHWNGKTGVMGHSMGGGATFLAAGDPATSFAVVVGMAPAETTPSAIAATAGVHAPTLVFSGTADAVTPPADHHVPIYNAVPASICRQFVSIAGGAHCYFANANAACDFGEGSSGGNITINRAEQQDIVFDLLDPWLSFYLKGVCNDWPVFTGLLATDTRIAAQNDCTYQLPGAPVIVENGSELSTSASGDLQWYLNGSPLVGETTQILQFSGYGEGTYTVSVTDANGCSVFSDPMTIGAAGLVHPQISVLEIAPNPVRTVLSVRVSEDVRGMLTDAAGRVLEVRDLSGESNWPVEHLSNGIYFLHVENGASLRFVKQ